MGTGVCGRWEWVGGHQSLPSPTKLTQITVASVFQTAEDTANLSAPELHSLWKGLPEPT